MIGWLKNKLTKTEKTDIVEELKIIKTRCGCYQITRYITIKNNKNHKIRSRDRYITRDFIVISNTLYLDSSNIGTLIAIDIRNFKTDIVKEAMDKTSENYEVAVNSRETTLNPRQILAKQW